MKQKSKPFRHAAFTLVELLVVIAIISLLIAVLLPAVGVVRNSAKNAQGGSQFAALEQALEAYRGEQSLGGTFPPSAGDAPNNPHQIADPTGTTAEPNMWITGGHLLVHALLGADRLGPPGFIDTNRNGIWADDTHSGQGGAYEVDEQTAEPVRTRYGGGSGFVSDKLAAQTQTLRQLAEESVVVQMDSEFTDQATGRQPLFVDPWNHPILYYRANKAARFMAGSRNDGQPAVYRQEDNGIITGSAGGTNTWTGADFGTAADVHGHVHFIAKVTEPPAKAVLDDGISDVLTIEEYEHSFARFIFDSKSQVRNEPVRKDTYLLISAGADAIYGSEDDIVNWQRTTE